MDDIVTLRVYASRLEAEMAKSLLDAYKIKCFITADDAGGMRLFPMAYTYGVELKVLAKDLEAAENILEEKSDKSRKKAAE